MSIVKRKNVSGGTYYFNTTTKKFASEAAYKKSQEPGWFERAMIEAGKNHVDIY